MKLAWVCSGLLFSWMVLGSLQFGSVSGQPPQKTDGNVVHLNGHQFRLPAGFTIEIAAQAPQTERPITASQDDQGRLYVAESSGSNEKVDIQLQKKPHRILCLEDRDGDGKYETSKVFADQMMFPEGTLWMQGSLYVAAPPSIWKLTDTDGDGVADKREEWFKGKTLTGCANDLHGPYEGRDGWIYWCKGAFAQQDYEIRGKKWSTKASHIFRCLPDGSGFEPVMTGGMDNPVDTVFTPEGERIFTTTFFQHPGAGLRDGLIHAVYGGVYGKVHDVIKDHPWTSHEVMPVLTHMGAAAPCGLHCYESEGFGSEYRGNLFSCQFNLRKVSRHQLQSQGSGLKSLDSDFVVSNQVDFHPTDVIEDADGSLLILDTGGWYKLCCPTSQLVKPDVRGAIYRVRKNGQPRVDDPWGKKIAWGKVSVDQLVGYLKDPRWGVRAQAAQRVAKAGNQSIPAIEAAYPGAKSVQEKQALLWALARIGNSQSLEVITRRLPGENEQVVQAGLNALSLHRYLPAKSILMEILKNGAPANRRLSAEVLGRIGAKESVPALLEAARTAPDRAMAHAITYALYEIGDFQKTRLGLLSRDPATVAITLNALELINPSALQANDVLAALKMNAGQLQETCWWLISRHQDWGKEVQPHLVDALNKVESGGIQAWVGRLSVLAKSPAVGELLAKVAQEKEASKTARVLVIRAMGQSGVREVSGSWVDSWKKVLEGNEENLAAEVLQAIQSLRITPVVSAMLQDSFKYVFKQETYQADTRLRAGALFANGYSLADEADWKLVSAAMDPSQPVSNRVKAAEVLSRAKLSSAQLLLVCKVMERASPFEADRLLDAFANCSEDRVGEELVSALNKSPALGGLRMELIRDKLKKFGPNTQARLKELEARIRENNSKNLAKMESMSSLVSHGDIRRGQLIFQSSKGACSVCHAIGYLGGKTGPDLTRIGQIRTERDLLESILFPSASFVRSYEPTKVITGTGKIFQGLLKSEDPREILLVTGPDQTARISRDDIETMEPGTVSVMPAGLDQQFTPQELADLVAFLKACK